MMDTDGSTVMRLHWGSNLNGEQKILRGIICYFDFDLLLFYEPKGVGGGGASRAMEAHSLGVLVTQLPTILKAQVSAPPP